MANPEHLAVLNDGVQAWNRWRKRNPTVRPCLDHADLSGRNLSQANFAWATLREAKLRNATLTRVDFTGADLEGADATEVKAPYVNLSRSHLRQVLLTGADLRQAVFTSAQFRRTRLVRANLRQSAFSGTKISRTSVDEADFAGSVLYEALFIDVDLSNAFGLDACHHKGPSALDGRTLARSGPLPLRFLRGCGLSDWEITATQFYSPNVSSKTVIDIAYQVIEMRNKSEIQYFSCFISYSHKDQRFARRLHDALQAHGIRCWLDEKQLLPGDALYEHIDRGIRLWDKFLLCCSQHSLAATSWVDKEIITVLEKEDELSQQRGAKINALIPLNLDGYVFTDGWRSGYRAEIRRRMAANFVGWEQNDESFEREIQGVIRSLRADESARELAPRPRL